MNALDAVGLPMWFAAAVVYYAVGKLWRARS
jgi:hypothetical protein